MTAETSNARGERVLVPRVPTQAMQEAFNDWRPTEGNNYAGAQSFSAQERWAFRQRYAAMLAAAPPQPAASAPVGVEAVRGAWLAAITLANNICVQESDRENDRDGDTGWIDGTAECAKRIREYAHPTDAELLEMLDEAGANAAKAALAQQPAAVDGAYPTPRNRAEAAALARLALAHLGVIDAHIDAAIARCETNSATQHKEPSV